MHSLGKPKKAPDKGATGGKEDPADSQKDGNLLLVYIKDHCHRKV